MATSGRLLTKFMSLKGLDLAFLNNQQNQAHKEKISHYNSVLRNGNRGFSDQWKGAYSVTKRQKPTDWL